MSPCDTSFADLSAAELYAILRLRCDVFVVEQECVYPDLDGRDAEANTRHIWIAHDGGVAAYVRLLDDGEARRIGRVVTHPDHRRCGLAGELVRHVLDTTEGPWVLDAQTYLTQWYERLGFRVTGDEYLDDGIPHVPMRRGDSPRSVPTT